MTVVIPAYNEGARLPAFLAVVCRHLEVTYQGRAEVIIVDDGSGDDLIGAISGVGRPLGIDDPGRPSVCMLRHTENQGKGAAIRTGLRHARGALVLISDADGATPIEEEAELRKAIEDGADVAVGSRLMVSTKCRQRRFVRRVLSRLVGASVRLVADCGVRDTQCGFKMLRREAALAIAEKTHICGFAFDVELLRVARSLGYKIAEVPVSWKEMPGSKVGVTGGLAMLRDVAKLHWHKRREPSSV